MTIILSDREYPESFATLKKMGVPLIAEERAKHQDIRPLRIGFLNLMPTAVMKNTEEQFFFLIGSTPLQIIPEMLAFDEYVSSDARKKHLDAFYRKFSEVKEEGLDGLIVTGANLEEHSFEEVHYWREFKELVGWARKSVASTLYSCWGAHAALNVFYGIERERYTNKDGVPRKITGLFEHNLSDQYMSPFTIGLPDIVLCPHSHWSGVPRGEVRKQPELRILLENPEAGILLMEGRGGRELYIQGHPEYAADALRKEYERDRLPERFGEKAQLPQGYFVDGDFNKPSPNLWRASGVVLFHNWINHVYQTTNFDLRKTLME